MGARINEFYCIIVNHTNQQIFFNMQLLSIQYSKHKILLNSTPQQPRYYETLPWETKTSFHQIENNAVHRRCNVNNPAQPE